MSRLIILPSDDTDKSRHTHQLAVGGTMINTTEQTHITFGLSNSLDSILAFYLPKEISSWDARALFRAEAPGFDDGLRRALAEEWINQNCTLPVIAQANQSGGAWSFWILDGTLRRDEFYNWALAAATHKLQKFKLVLPENEKIGLSKEIAQSIDELVRGKRFVTYMGATIHISIWDETDAIEFKLKWSDYFG